MICPPCRAHDHLGCASPDCPCGHHGSPVRALTHDERHARVMGLPLGHVLPREEPADA